MPYPCFSAAALCQAGLLLLARPAFGPAAFSCVAPRGLRFRLAGRTPGVRRQHAADVESASWTLDFAHKEQPTQPDRYIKREAPKAQASVFRA